MILPSYNYIIHCTDRYADKLQGIRLSENLIADAVHLSHKTNQMAVKEVSGKDNVNQVFPGNLSRDATMTMIVKKLVLSPDKSKFFLNVVGKVNEGKKSYDYEEVSTFTLIELSDGTHQISKIKTTMISSLFNC